MENSQFTPSGPLIGPQNRTQGRCDLSFRVCEDDAEKHSYSTTVKIDVHWMSKLNNSGDEASDPITQARP